MLKVAVVGGGQMGSKIYLPALATMSDVEVAALVEPVQERREFLAGKFRIGRAVASVAELRQGEADAAFLLTREEIRREPLTALLELGLHVLVEKPLAMNLQEAEELARLAKAKQRTVMVGLNRRFMPVYAKAKEWLAGRPVQLVRAQKERGNIRAHSIHVLSALCWLCGRPQQVQAMGNFTDQAMQQESLSAALVRFDSGAVGIFQTSAGFGTRKETLEINGPGYTIFVDAPERAYLFEGEAKRQEFRPDQQTWYLSGQDRYGFTQEIRHFLDCVAAGKQPENNAEEAMITHRLVFEILEQMRRHGRVELP